MATLKSKGLIIPFVVMPTIYIAVKISCANILLFEIKPSIIALFVWVEAVHRKANVLPDAMPKADMVCLFQRLSQTNLAIPLNESSKCLRELSETPEGIYCFYT